MLSPALQRMGEELLCSAEPVSLHHREEAVPRELRALVADLVGLAVGRDELMLRLGLRAEPVGAENGSTDCRVVSLVFNGS